MRLSKSEVTFVQAGAADGVMGDPLRPLILRHHLRGLLIEPVPWSFARLRENYKNEPQVMFANCAVGSAGGRQQMFGFDPAADASVHRMASLHNHHPAMDGADGVRRHSFEVEVRTFSDLLSEFQVEPSVLVVDVEGMDAEVVHMALDAGCVPSVLMYEYVHLPREEHQRCLRRLKDSGYSFVEADVDTYAVRDDLLRATGAIYT